MANVFEDLKEAPIKTNVFSDLTPKKNVFEDLAPKGNVFSDLLTETGAQLQDITTMPARILGTPHPPMVSKLATETIPKAAQAIGEGLEKVYSIGATPIRDLGIPIISKAFDWDIPSLSMNDVKNILKGKPTYTVSDVAPSLLDLGVFGYLGFEGVKGVAARVQWNRNLDKRFTDLYAANELLASKEVQQAKSIITQAESFNQAKTILDQYPKSEDLFNKIKQLRDNGQIMWIDDKNCAEVATKISSLWSSSAAKAKTGNYAVVIHSPEEILGAQTPGTFPPVKGAPPARTISEPIIPGVNTPVKVPGIVGKPATYETPVAQPATQPKLILTPAIILSDGKVIPGKTHEEALKQAGMSADTHVEGVDFAAGYLTDKEEFLSREQGAELMGKQGEAGQPAKLQDHDLDQPVSKPLYDSKESALSDIKTQSKLARQAKKMGHADKYLEYSQKADQIREWIKMKYPPERKFNTLGGWMKAKDYSFRWGQVGKALGEDWYNRKEYKFLKFFCGKGGSGIDLTELYEHAHNEGLDGFSEPKDVMEGQTGGTANYYLTTFINKWKETLSNTPKYEAQLKSQYDESIVAEGGTPNDIQEENRIAQDQVSAETPEQLISGVSQARSPATEKLDQLEASRDINEVDQLQEWLNAFWDSLTNDEKLRYGEVMETKLKQFNQIPTISGETPSSVTPSKGIEDFFGTIDTGKPTAQGDIFSQPTGEGKVGYITQKLIDEAKQYDTFEEFVKSKGGSLAVGDKLFVNSKAQETYLRKIWEQAKPPTGEGKVEQPVQLPAMVDWLKMPQDEVARKVQEGIVCHRGTATGAKPSNVLKLGGVAGMPMTDPGFYGQGKYYSTCKWEAEQYGAVESVTIRLDNPLVLNGEEARRITDQYGTAKDYHTEEGFLKALEQSKQLTRDLLAEGYDGIIVQKQALNKEPALEVLMLDQDYGPLYEGGSQGAGMEVQPDMFGQFKDRKPATPATKGKMNCYQLRDAGELTDNDIMDALKASAGSKQLNPRIKTLPAARQHSYQEAFDRVISRAAANHLPKYSYDPTSGLMPKKWLFYNAYAAVKRAITEERSTTGDWRDTCDKMSVLNFKEKFITENGEEPTIKQIAAELGATYQKRYGQSEWDKMMRTQDLQDLLFFEKSGAAGGREAAGMARDKPVPAASPMAQGPHAIEMPELVAAVVELSGNDVLIKNLAKYWGYFSSGSIKLDPSIFKNPDFAAAVLSHEFGHLVDWLPDETLKRGNLLGRLLTLYKFMQGTFGALDNKVLRGELKKLTQWWNPFNDKNKKYAAYRYSSKELYAEFISVLFSQPEMARALAPTFYQAFWEELDKKPEAKNTLLELNHFLTLSPNEKAEVRLEIIHEGNKKAEEQYKKARELNGLKKKNMWFHFRYGFSDKKTAIIQEIAKFQKAGGKLNPEDNPRYYLEEMAYVGGKLKNFHHDVQLQVMQPLMDMKMSFDDVQQYIGDYLFLDRVRTERAEMPNPWGFTPKPANATLEAIEKKLGPEKWAELQKSVQKFHGLIKKLLVEAEKAGFYKAETVADLMTNPAYATFQVLDYVDDYITAAIINQVGTLKGIANPFTATVIKMESLIRAIERNKTRASVVNFIKQANPAEIEAVKIKRFGKGPVIIPEKQGYSIIRLYEEGKLRAYYTDPYIANTVNYSPAAEVNMLMSVIKAMNKYFRPVYVNLNLGFQSYNLIRDFQRNWQLMGNNVPLWKVFQVYFRARPLAAARIWGNTASLPLEIYRMQQEGMLSVTFNDVLGGTDDELSQLAYLQHEWGIVKHSDFSKRWGVFSKIPGVGNFFDFIEGLGNFIETWGKVSGYLARENIGLSPKEVAHEVRMYSGSPDFLTKGAQYGWSNDFFLYSNAMIQGLRGDIEGGGYNPRTRQGYWWRTIKMAIMPAIVAAMVGLGMFGERLKRIFDNISEFDKTNYICIPFGETEDGKPLYFRIPLPETARMIHGIVYKALTFDKDNILKSMQQISAPTAGQLPSLNPGLEIMLAWGPYIFTGKPISLSSFQILSDEEIAAGVEYSLPTMLKWTGAEMGLTPLRQTRTDLTPIEEITQWIPGVSRFIKVRDTERAAREEKRELQAPRIKEQAIRTLERRKLK